jgi:2-oxoisovalerate dehydrogenase E1 component alpha subunit
VDDDAVTAVLAEAERFADNVRVRMNGEPHVDPDELFQHVLAEPPASLRRQRDELQDEIADTAEELS